MWPSSFVCPFAMYALANVNANVPSIHHTNCAHYVLYPMNCTMEIRSITQISVLMALQHKPMAGLGLMVMLILCTFDTRDYCRMIGIRKCVCVRERERERKEKCNQSESFAKETMQCSGEAVAFAIQIEKQNRGIQTDTYCLYFSSDDFSRSGMPDKNKMMSVVNNGDKMPIHSIPWMTLSDMTKIPHQIRISPK